MTKKEADVLKAAFRFWRASNGLDPTRPGEITIKPDEIEISKVLLLEAAGEAVKEVKDWVFVKQSADPDRPVILCTGCGAEEIVKCPLPVDQFVAINNGFHARHLDCGPVGDVAAGP